jgi:hypothetical protein
MTGGSPLGVGRLDRALGWAVAPEWRVCRRVAVARFCFFSRSRFKSEAAEQTCGREKCVTGTTPYYIPRLTDEYTYPIFIEVREI